MKYETYLLVDEAVAVEMERIVQTIRHEMERMVQTMRHEMEQRKVLHTYPY